eukprot:symbB.v1.2.010787.t1/scaffold707.1/size170859/8
MLRHVNGSIPCGVAFFGDDPRPNLPKLCSCLHSLPWPESLVDGLNETISRSLLPRVEAGPAEATCSAEDDGSWTPCSILSSRHDGSLVPDRILPRLPVEEQRDMALRKLDLCHRLVGPDQALRILGVWPTNIQMGVVPIKASSAPLCAVVYSPVRGAVWDSRAAIFCPTEPPKCLEGSCECADTSLSRTDLRHRDAKEEQGPPCWTCLPSGDPEKSEAPELRQSPMTRMTPVSSTPSMGARSQIQQLRSEHVPAAPIGLRIEMDGKQVRASDHEVECILFRYADGSYLTGCNCLVSRFITQITGYTTGTTLRSLRFHSSKGRISADYGCQVPPADGQAFSFVAPPGTVLAAFSRKEVPCGQLEEAICIAHPSSQDIAF